MKMTDKEILDSWSQAVDRKKHVKILADRNGVGVWEMMEALKALKAPGLDSRWYQSLNPARKTEKDAAGSDRIDYMKKVIAAQDKKLKETAAEAEELKTAYAELQQRYDELRSRAEEDAVAFKSQTKDCQKKIAEATEICEAQIEEIRKKDAEIAELRKRQGINATSRLGLIRWFCRELTGPAAYLMGRIVEHLLDWRETGSAEELRKFLETMQEDDNEN